MAAIEADQMSSNGLGFPVAIRWREKSSRAGRQKPAPFLIFFFFIFFPRRGDLGPNLPLPSASSNRRRGFRRQAMSGSRLCVVLGELGFDGQDALDPDSFEWPFQYEEARPVLDWICSSLRPSNVLSLPELSQY